MSHDESVVRLRHMLDHAREAVAMAKGKTRDDLRTNRMLNLALVRLLEIVGEAASRTPLDERTQRHTVGPDCRTAQPADSRLRLGGLRNPMADRQPRLAAVDSGSRADRFVCGKLNSLKSIPPSPQIPACVLAGTLIVVIVSESSAPVPTDVPSRER